MKIKLEPWAIEPTRAHATDAGLDLYASETVLIMPGDSAVIDTGVAIELPPYTFGKLESKSGLNIKHSVVSCGGVVDEGYSGNIICKLYNFGSEPYLIHKGDKIIQLIVQPCLFVDVEVVDEIKAVERQKNGFGSTGR